ncbi:MAG: aldehyde dehydrogenase family protein [Bdellovibrionales bacterium]|nr:aldehyde dehydrogenase family protein [Bdellovibrionales bacterium]
MKIFRKVKKTQKALPFLGSYIKGKFQKVNKKRLQQKHKSPADFEDLIFYWDEHPCLDLNSLCFSGKKAQRKWSQTPFPERVKKLKKLKPIIKKNIKNWGELISRETGKALWESEGEVKALLLKLDFTLEEALKRIKTQSLPPYGQIRFKSRGLCLVIGPFNFPMHLPFGQILPALLAGNAVIFKASEKAPASAQALTGAFDQIGLESGLYQLVQGGGKISKKLCNQNLIDAIFFTGSFETGDKIKQSLVKDYNKLLALEMGGYNSSLVWDDADLNLAVQECLKACFWTSGQRCSSCSQIILHKKIASEFIKLFLEKAKQLKVNHWSQNPWMGSLIDKKSLQRFFKFQKQIKKAGGQFLLEGKQLYKEKGYYVSPGIYKMAFDKNSLIGTQETFTPQVIIYETRQLKEAVELINHSGFGLSLSVFSKDKKVKEEMFQCSKVGLVYYNLASVGASSYLPFGGVGKSGNDRPAGAFAIDSCVIPMAEKGF